MHTLLFARARARLLPSIAFALVLLAASTSGAQNVDLADKPLFSTTSVPGNLLLSLSVEYPTANTSAYFSTTPYAAGTLYNGYFDGAKCYRYLYNSASPALSFFQSDSAASAGHKCASSASRPLWSGNYLNYAAMQSLDIFRWVMTGGNRLVDTAGGSGMTILQKATHSGQGGAGDAPNKSIPFADQTGSTPFRWANGVKSRIWGAGIKLWLTGAGDLDAGSITAVDYQDSLVADGSPDGAAVYALYMNVRVCDPAVSLEANCVAYGSQSKPEGLMQQYAGSLRYSAFAYLNDSSPTRDGGVMRARMAYIGPKVPQPGAAAAINPNPEWDAATGVMIANPDPADAVATNTSTGNRTTVHQSGVLNYLNKFGYASGTYKTFDPVSELYYASLRYLKGQANVTAYSDMSGASAATANAWADGFPVVTDWSTDPIIYACQKNFILGIGDVNTHRDGNLPGGTASNLEPPQPPEVSADASAAPPVNVFASTNLVGSMEGTSNLAWRWATGDEGRYYIAGLAYDAHLPIDGKGVRKFTDANNLTTISTVSTYWLDVLEYQTYVNNNQYYYAAKYGGFTVPSGYTYGGALPTDSWYNSTNTLGSNKQPDNYFTASNATLMQSGLTSAFAKIVSENNAANGTALSLPTPNVSRTGTTSYSATYDPTSWTGQVIGSTVTFDPDGSSTVTQQWDARALLSAPSVTADSRRIVTCCTVSPSAPGLPFTLASLRGASLDPRTNYASFASVPGVASSAQSIANYIAYLRGDASKETANGGAYRTRKFRLGDIVDAKPVTVGPPNSAFYDTYNPGYAAFKAQFANRSNVVYAGANDGMLHAFDGTVGNTSPLSGSELFAYIPSFAYGSASTAATTGLASLGNPSFVHHYLVDATPGEFDIDLNRTGAGGGDPKWRTLLIGGLGKGGKGYYALDVTDPTAWTDEATIASKVMWEFTDPRMGYTFGTPTVAKTKKYGWVVVFTSGYANADGRGYFFIVNPSNGALLEAVATPAGAGSTSSPLNMGQATAYIENYADMTADAIYAGDLQGGVWRLDVSASDVTLPYPTPTKIARLTDSLGNAQPITTRPLVEVAPNTSTRYVLVGTGRLLADSDIGSGLQQSFYAIVDGLSAAGAFYGSPSQPLPAGASFPITRAQLNADSSVLTGIGSSPTSALGWYLDLAVSSGIAERVNVDPIASQGAVAFVGNLPNGSACSPSGNGSLHVVQIANGQTLLLKSDLVTPASAIAISGLGTDVAIVNVDGKVEVSTGSSKGTVARNPITPSSAGAVKQINWRDVPSTN